MRQQVLQSAREAFAERGFNGATVRDIAARAGVDASLVVQFFGSKAGAFAAAMELPFETEEVVASLLRGPRSGLGARMVRTFLALWDQPETGGRMLALLRSAATHDAAAQRLRELIETGILGPLARALDAPDAQLRAELVGSQLVGLGFARYVLRIEPLASEPVQALEARVGPTIQRYLTGPL